MKLDNYVCDGQLSLWDIVPPNNQDFQLISHDETVRLISEAVGLDFKYRDDFWGYEAKKGKVRMSIEFSHYRGINNDKPYIGCDINTNTAGCSSPCDSIEEAIQFFKKGIPRYLETKPLSVEIKGLLDDPYCPKCNFRLDDYIDSDKCPECGVKIEWSHYHKLNEE